MRIENVQTSRLAEMAWDKNPRKISDHDLAALRRSLKFFGTVEPVVVNRRSGHVVGGHQRVKAAEAEGIAELPVVYVDLDDPSEKQLNLALNRISGEFDLDKLGALLADLEKAGADLALTGFTDTEIQELVSALDEPQDGLCDPDAVPEPPDDPATQPGDLIGLGRHRLLCGDSADPEQVARLLDGARIQLVNTDPPYNVKVEPRSNNAIASGMKSTKGNVPADQRKRVRTKAGSHHQQLDLARHPGKSKPTGKMRPKDRVLENDFVSDEAFRGLLRAWFKNLADALEPGRAFYLWGGYSNIKNYPAAMEEAGLYFSQAIIWDKQWPVLTRKDFMGAHEWCQPADTRVETTEGPVPIASLRDGDRVLGWSSNHNSMVGLCGGLAVRQTSRAYRGPLLGVRVGPVTTWCTPAHLWTVKLSEAAGDAWCVYLMRRGEWWRIGKSKLLSTWGLGVKHRLWTEDGEHVWILSVHGSSLDAAIQEQVILAQYGIPTTTWSETAKSRRTIADVRMLYDRLDLAAMRQNALRVLTDHGRSINHPLVSRPALHHKVSRRVSFRVRACNLLPGIMLVPLPGRGQESRWTPLEAIDREPFEGDVYSLDVERFGHYVADGIVTHNCFYGWREGAAHYFTPGINNATDLWRVKKVTPEAMVHLTEKPVELAELAMTYSSKKGENVLDLFGGSGSTLIAAERMDRRAFVAELDPAYCDVMVLRFQTFTGKKSEGWRGNG